LFEAEAESCSEPLLFEAEAESCSARERKKNGKAPDRRTGNFYLLPGEARHCSAHDGDMRVRLCIVCL
jgi:hypothetical protein